MKVYILENELYPYYSLSSRSEDLDIRYESQIIDLDEDIIRQYNAAQKTLEKISNQIRFKLNTKGL